MSLTFATYFAETFSTPLGIRRNHVEAALANPDQMTDIVRPHGLLIKFYTKFVDMSPRPHTLLIQTSKINGTDTVVAAFKLFPDLTPDFPLLNPAQCLYHLTSRFGVEVTVGEQVHKLVLDERISLENEPVRAVSFKEPGVNNFFQQGYHRVDTSDGTHHLDCALVYCIDMTEYCRYVDSHY